MRLSLLVLALLGVAFAQEDDAQEDAPMQQEEPARSVMAPESQEIVLAETSPECYDAVFAVINGEAEQKSLSEECNKELVAGYGKTPMGQLQQREGMVVQLASLLRVSASCRKQFEAAAAASQGQGEASEVTQACQDDFQGQFKAMQQWIGSTTISRMSPECKTEASTGNVGKECEQEFLAVKPGVIDTLDTQNNQKLKEPVKEQKPPKQPKAKREPKAKPWVDPALVFLLFWTLAIGGSMVYVCFLYHRDDKFHPVAVVEEEVQAEEEVAPEDLSKSKQKQLAKEEKQKLKGKGRHF